MNASKFPHPIRVRRFLQALSQDDLAQRAGVKQSDVSRLERGFPVSDRVKADVEKALGMGSKDGSK